MGLDWSQSWEGWEASLAGPAPLNLGTFGASLLGAQYSVSESRYAAQAQLSRTVEGRCEV